MFACCCFANVGGENMCLQVFRKEEENLKFRLGTQGEGKALDPNVPRTGEWFVVADEE